MADPSPLERIAEACEQAAEANKRAEAAVEELTRTMRQLPD